MIDERSGRNSFIRDKVESFIEKNPEFALQEVRNIEVRTLQSILDEYNNGRILDYMSIDIEGLEYDVLSNYDLKNNGPKILTLEIIRDNTDISSDMMQLLMDADYFLYLKIASNYTFVKNKYKDIIFD